MSKEEIMQQLKNKLQNEIDQIGGYIQREVESGTEDTLYRECKLFVFAKTILGNLDNFISYKEEKNENIENLMNTLLFEDDIIETIYSYLYEKNGTKYDFFMDRVRVLESIDFFIQHR